MNNTLLIGTGGCGGKLLDQTIEILKERVNLKNSYDYLFVNSNKNEITSLANCKVGINTLFINGNGTGKDQAKAIEAISNDRLNVSNKLSTAVDYKSAYIFYSADGGFGSGSIRVLSKVLKTINEDIKVNLLVAVPKKTLAKRLEFKNTITTYEEINTLLKAELIDSFQIIENDKIREDEDEVAFNKRTMELFIDSLEMPHDSLDANDSLMINSARGYKLILPIDKTIKDLEEGIEQAKKESPFMVTDKTRASYVYGIYDKAKFSQDDIGYEYDIKESQKIVDGDKTIFVITGLGSPNKEMEKFNKLYKKSVNTADEEDDDEDDFVSFKSEKDKEALKSKKEKKEDSKDRKDVLKKLISDNLWN